MVSLDELDELEPAPNDFRRAGRGVPMIRNATTGKMERYRRSSSAGKVLDDESALTDWRIRTILEGAAQRPDLLAVVSTLDHEADKKAIRDIAEQCLVTGKGTHRQTTGTALHAMLDHVDANHDWTPAPQFVDVVNAYVAVRDAYGLVPIDIEVRCVNDEFRLAGTMDRRYRLTKAMVAPDGTIIPIGSVIAGDTKTGRTLEYAAGSYATQLAAYVDSVRYDVVTDERTPFDPPTVKDWALIVHLDHEAATCEIHFVDLEAGRQGLHLATGIHEWRRRSDLLTPARAPLVAVGPDPTEPETTAVAAVVPPGASDDTSAPDAPDATPAATETDLEAVRDWLRERIQAIKQDGPQAVAMLQRLWPIGVAGLKHSTQTEAELDLVADAVGKVEAEYGMTFPTIDPRKAWTYSDRWTMPDLPPGDVKADDDSLAALLAQHPRSELLRKWSRHALGNLDETITDRVAITHALYEFALVNDEWSDDDITEMLVGTLRALGYDNGLDDLGKVRPEHAPSIMSAAFAITADTAILLIDESGRPIVRNIKQ